jgi:small conductance mechanosensitive channel
MEKQLQKLNLAELSQYGELALGYATNFVAAIAILFIGLWLAGVVKRRIIALGEKYDTLDITLTTFLGMFAKYAIIALTLVVVLSQFGVQTTSLIAILGAAGLAIGLALQGTLSNVAAGLMILFLRPYKVGDYIEAGGESGTVKLISLFVTELATGDNIQIFIPNAKLWGSAIRNFSYHRTRRVEIIMGISYDDDINKAMKALHGVIAKDDRIHKTPEPLIAVGELADSSVNLKVRVWVASKDLWSVKYHLTKAFKEEFDKKKITIPYPTKTVYEYRQS